MRRAAFVAGIALLLAVPVAAQEQSDAKLRAQQEELARIRRERDELQRRMRNLQGRVHDIKEEVTNIDRQHDATVRVVRSLDQQLTTLNGEVENTTANLVRAQDEVQVKRAVLRKRLVEIYKRGPLFTFRSDALREDRSEISSRATSTCTSLRSATELSSRVSISFAHRSSGSGASSSRFRRGVEQNRIEKSREAERLAALEDARQGSLRKRAAGPEESSGATYRAREDREAVEQRDRAIRGCAPSSRLATECCSVGTELDSHERFRPARLADRRCDHLPVRHESSTRTTPPPAGTESALPRAPEPK